MVIDSHAHKYGFHGNMHIAGLHIHTNQISFRPLDLHIIVYLVQK